MKEKKNINYVSFDDSSYPKKLKYIYNPPKGLYVIGKLPLEDRVSIAIIGARECSVSGREYASFFAGELARNGIQIISGLARGIDGYAHRGALNAGMDTFGILGCGIDLCYPKENIELFEKMEYCGGIISEYTNGTPPLAAYFPQRNRIISGMSEGILIIEARERSGSLITVEHGLEQGKDIFVLPGRISDGLSKGCNALLKAGAVPVTEPSDILHYYGMEDLKKKEAPKKNNKLLEKQDEMVYSRLCLVPKHVNQVIYESKLPLYLVMESLISLEKKGYIKQPHKNYYIKILE